MADESTVAAAYPQLAFLLDDPEMGPILRAAYQAKEEGHPWTDAQFQAETMKTQWFRSQSSSARRVLALYNTEPGTYQRLFDQKYNLVVRTAGILGVGLSTDRMWNIANKALAEDLDEFEIRRLLIEGDWHLTAGTTEAQVRQTYSNYFLPVSDSQLKTDTAHIVDGTQTIEGLNAVLADQAKTLYPQFASAIDSGRTPREFFEPYRQHVSQLLEVTPDTVDPITDQRWRPIFDSVDEKGNHRAMTLYEADQYVRQMPEWRNTGQARAQSASLGESLLKTFGAVA